MFAIGDRVRLRADPRIAGEVRAWLTRNWDNRSGLMILWDNGWLEEIQADKVEPIAERRPRRNRP